MKVSPKSFVATQRKVDSIYRAFALCETKTMHSLQNESPTNTFKNPTSISVHVTILRRFVIFIHLNQILLQIALCSLDFSSDRDTDQISHMESAGKLCRSE